MAIRMRPSDQESYIIDAVSDKLHIISFVLLIFKIILKNTILFIIRKDLP